LVSLAQGPIKGVICYKGYVINGFWFHIKSGQSKLKTQNSNVVEGKTESGKKDFHDVLEEVIVLEYNALNNRASPKVVLFRCK